MIFNNKLFPLSPHSPFTIFKAVHKNGMFWCEYVSDMFYVEFCHRVVDLIVFLSYIVIERMFTFFIIMIAIVVNQIIFAASPPLIVWHDASIFLYQPKTKIKKT